MCTRRILSHPISQSANKIWQTSFATPLIEDSVISSDWATLFCPIGWQNSHRNPDQRHDHVGTVFSMAFCLSWRRPRFSHHLICDLSGCCTPTSNLCTNVDHLAKQLFHNWMVGKVWPILARILPISGHTLNDNAHCNWNHNQNLLPLFCIIKALFYFPPFYNLGDQYFLRCFCTKRFMQIMMCVYCNLIYIG